jgi:hypothetical protein
VTESAPSDDQLTPTWPISSPQGSHTTINNTNINQIHNPSNTTIYPQIIQNQIYNPESQSNQLTDTTIITNINNQSHLNNLSMLPVADSPITELQAIQSNPTNDYIARATETLTGAQVSEVEQLPKYDNI